MSREYDEMVNVNCLLTVAFQSMLEPMILQPGSQIKTDKLF